MTKNQFLIRTGLKGEHRLAAKPYIDAVARYKGKLSYFRLLLLMHIAVTFGRRGPDDILGYVDAVMSREAQNDR